MKRIIYTLLLGLLSATAVAQKINRSFHNTSLSAALIAIDKSANAYDISFIYDELEDFTVTTDIRNKTVPDAVRQVLGFYPMKMTVKGHQIFVECTQKEKTKLSGRIVDRSGQPVMYANISLLSLRDSSFINGGVSDEAGCFVIPYAETSLLARISCIGYKTKVMNVTGKYNLGTIVLQQDEYSLKEVTVRAKMYQLTTEGVLVNVSGTDLGKLGYAPDVLKHLPFVREKDNTYTVFGKGTPQIYVNNRLIRDNNDLKQINSADIRQVKVITNPGAEYDATVNAVIRITTIKPVGNGLSGMVDGGVSVERKVSHHAGASFNYRMGGLDLFGSLGYDLQDSKANQTATTIYGDRKNMETTLLRNLYFGRSATLGFNNQFNDKLSVGMYYKSYDHPHTKFDCYTDLKSYNDDLCNNLLNIIDHRRYEQKSHSLNAYCDYNFAKETALKFDADYLNRTQTDRQGFSEEYGNLDSRNKSNSLLYSGRLTFMAPLGGGQIKTGGEASYTDNNNHYDLLAGATLANALSSTANEAKQNLYAGFAEYAHALGEKLKATVGIRYEHTDFSYYINGENSNEASKTYHGFYPSAAITYSAGDVEMSLAYRYSTRRPSYFSLRSAVAMNSPYSYEGGNPRLQPQKKNMLTYSLQWKDLQFMASYSMIKNASLYMIDMYDHSDSITFDQFRNVDRYRVLDLSLVYSPKLFKIWTPELNVELTKQYLTYQSAKYNSPYLDLSLQNRVMLPHAYLLGCDMEYNTAGNSGLQHQYANFYAEIYGVKTFFQERLRLNLKVTNVLNTSRERWSNSQNGVFFDMWNDGERRTVVLTLTYRFNQTKSKYKGEASTEELKRM